MSLILAVNMKLLREKSGLTQQQLADEAGISCRLYQSLEAGNANPTVETLSLIGQVLKVTTDQLLRLHFLRIPGSLGQFKKNFTKAFKDEPYWAILRDKKCHVHVANKAAEEFTRAPIQEPFRLCDQIEEGQHLKLVETIRREQELMPRSYESYRLVDGQKSEVQMHPTILFPEKGFTPLLVAEFGITDMADDQAVRYQFSEKLIEVSQSC